MFLTDGHALMGTIFDDNDTRLQQLDIGHCLAFGSFIPICDSFDVNIRLPMLWHMIERDGKKCKLLSYFFFEHTGYWTNFNRADDGDWANTQIRYDLNHKFFDGCFSKDEKNAILTTEVKSQASDGSYSITKDKLYVPSLADIINIPEHLKLGIGLRTRQLGEDASAVEIMYSTYWLRNPGELKDTALVVRGYADSQLILDSIDYDSDEVGVRAVMWIDAEKIRDL